MSDPKTRLHLTPWEAWQRFPPFYFRLFAKHDPTTPLSEAEIAISSGIAINRIREIVAMDDWTGVTHGEMRALTVACNFDPTNCRDRQRVAKYEKACQTRIPIPFQFLRRSPKWETEFLPIVRRMQSRLKSAAA